MRGWAFLCTMAQLLIILNDPPYGTGGAPSPRRSPAAGRQDATGVLARLMCPRTGEQTAVRIGRDPVDRVPAVVWCQHFPAGRIECGRECFTSLDGAEDPIALMEPA